MDYFTANGVTLWTFPPHCSHVLQPLYRSLYGPIKSKLTSLVMPEYAQLKKAAIYDIMFILARDTPLTLTQANAQYYGSF